MLNMMNSIKIKPNFAGLLSLILFGCGLFPTVSCARHVTIGAVLDSDGSIQIFRDAVRSLNNDPINIYPHRIFYNYTDIIFLENPIRTAKAVCESLISQQVSVVITNHPYNSATPPMAVSYTCGYYKIPVIGISVRESIFSDKNVHSSFLRTVPPYSEQTAVWVQLVRHFKWPSMIVIHSVDQEGRSLLGRLQNQVDAIPSEESLQIAKSVKYMSGAANYTADLLELRELESRVVLLYATKEDAENIYTAANALQLTGPGYVWIVSEQALLPRNTPYGVIGTRLQNTHEPDHIADSIQVIGRAFRTIDELPQNLTQNPPSECAVPVWEFGKIVYKNITSVVVENGKTGRVQFNEQGDRINSMYNIFNYQPGAGMVTIGNFSHLLPEKLVMSSEQIVWPGNETTKPKGIKISTYLKVVTIKETPFVYTEEYNEATCLREHKKVKCPQANSTLPGGEKVYCCNGYAIDLLMKLAHSVNFSFDVHLVEDKSYGSYERVNETRRWTGLVGEIVYGKADLIVAPLTINPERAEHIDFSKPFKYQGLTILVKKTTKDSSLTSFLQPFQTTLWILVGLSVHVVALVLYLLDRFSPFGRFKLVKSDDAEEDALNLSSAMWFAWGVLLNSGIGEGTPRSFSARVLGMVWAGFAMIIVASYTANLAAFLVLDRPVASISGIDDARLRNPQEEYKYATVKNSSVAMYFKRQVELSTMYRTMENRNYPDPDSAIQDVKDGKLQAFIWDSSRLEYEAATDCDLVTAGELFGRSGYGIGLPKNSPLTRTISLNILNYHESGAMEELDGEWILVKDTKCPEKDTSPATLGLTNMAGVFMMVAGGIVTGVFLIFIEIAYKRHRGLKEKELELAKTAADRWRGNIEKRKILRRSWEMMKEDKMMVHVGLLASDEEEEKRRTLRRTLLQQQQERKMNGTNENAAEQPHFGGETTANYPPVRLQHNNTGPIRNRGLYASPAYEENAV